MRNSVCVASRLALACALCGALVAPLAAADLGGYPPPQRHAEGILVPCLYNWTGPYIGVHLGYGWGTSSTFNDPYDGNGYGFDGAIDGFRFHPSGWLGGLQIGYNWQWDAFVFGLEGELGYLGASDENSIPTAFAKAEYAGYGTITARLGYGADRWLVYAKGGLAFASIKNEGGAVVGGLIDPFDYTSVNELHTGWALGAGVEYAFQRCWSMKLEYLYMDFGNDRSGNFSGDVFDHENSIHSLKVGVNYHLQGPYEPLK